jgi:D-alanyl-D-alanine carboxypeptidase
MKQALRSSSAVSFALLSSLLAGCATHQTHFAAARPVIDKPVGEIGLATRALAALSSNDVPAAIDWAEQAVAKTPGNAGFRAILGNAYFAGGRFHSAEGAYRDSLSINANQPQVLLKLALVQIAQGKTDEAVNLLNAGRGVLNPSDYGLALALAGHNAEAIAVLDPAAREVNADATVRQNLALAHALAGDWENARVIAAQDVPAGELDGRIHQWMQLSNPSHSYDQVAALVGVKPVASDPGQPLRLALNKTETQLAMATPAPQPQAAQAAPTPRPAFVAAVTPQQLPEPVVAVAPAPPPPRASALASLAASAAAEAKQVFDYVIPRHAQAIAKPVVKPTKHPVIQAALHRGNSPAVVQLGAYQSPERVLAAWNGAARKYGALKAFLPMSARFASAKGTFYRLSVHGFQSDDEARNLCMSIRKQGASCFVRNVAGDAPVNIAMR